MNNYIKHTILIGILAVSVILSSGCKKYLERDAPTATTDELWWKSQDQLNNYLTAVYNNALPSGALGGTYWTNSRMQMEGITDLAVHRGNFLQTWSDLPVDNVTNTDAGITDLFRFQYAHIRDCTRILENYQKVYVADTVLKKRFAAEARALRAFAYLQLFRFYGNIPLVKHVVQFTDADVKNLPRGTEQEIVTFISSELETAAVDLPANYSEAEYYRVSKAVCYALQVQLFLQVKQYDKVIEVFGKLKALNLFELYINTSDAAKRTNSYSDIFTYTGLTNKERIWIKVKGNSGVMGRFGPASVQGGQATLCITSALVNLYETKQGLTLDELSAGEKQQYLQNPNLNNNRDPRLNFTVLLPGTNLITGVPYNPFDNNSNNTTRLGYNSANVTGYLVRKYMTETDRTAQYGRGNLNFIIIRYAEMMLSYVEALIESGQWTHPDVKAYINQIRNRAGMPDYEEAKYNTQDKIRGLYRRERTVELALEGVRLFDIRRWQIGPQALNGPVYGAWDPNTNQPVLIENRVFTAPKHYLFPIPQVEMINNTGLGGVNNPGW